MSPFARSLPCLLSLASSVGTLPTPPRWDANTRSPSPRREPLLSNLRTGLPRTPVNTGGSKGEEISRLGVRSHAFADQLLRLIKALPTTDLRLLVTLEALVDLKELLDLAQVLIGQVLQGAYVRKARVVVGIGERGGDKAVVGRVAHGTRQDPVAHDNP